MCCKLFNEINLPPEYANLNDGTGKCKYLKDNLCIIYDNRPFLCNSQLVYEKEYKNIYSYKKYEELLKEQCVLLINKFGGNYE